jgi:hypothetical protein
MADRRRRTDADLFGGLVYFYVETAPALRPRPSPQQPRIMLCTVASLARAPFLHGRILCSTLSPAYHLAPPPPWPLLLLHAIVDLALGHPPCPRVHHAMRPLLTGQIPRGLAYRR